MIAPNEQIAGKKARIKVAAPKISTREEAESVLTEIAILANAKRKVTADMDAEILTIKDRCQPELTKIEEQLAAATDRLAKYADEHSEIFPGDRKSVEWLSGKFGFRTDTPSLALSNRTFGWAKILVMIYGRRLRKFIRTKMEVDKEAILARCGTLAKPTKFQQKFLPTLGLKLVQEEKFFVEPDLTKEVRS
jgi:phage host-nuclease inhibitor protein Gam